MDAVESRLWSIALVVHAPGRDDVWFYAAYQIAPSKEDAVSAVLKSAAARGVKWTRVETQAIPIPRHVLDEALN